MKVRIKSQGFLDSTTQHLQCRMRYRCNRKCWLNGHLELVDLVVRIVQLLCHAGARALGICPLVLHLYAGLVMVQGWVAVGVVSVGMTIQCVYNIRCRIAD